MISFPRQGVSHRSASSLHGRWGGWGALGPPPVGLGTPTSPKGTGSPGRVGCGRAPICLGFPELWWGMLGRTDGIASSPLLLSCPNGTR